MGMHGPMQDIVTNLSKITGILFESALSYYTKYILISSEVLLFLMATIVSEAHLKYCFLAKEDVVCLSRIVQMPTWVSILEDFNRPREERRYTTKLHQSSIPICN